jgi:hypothetical protein
LRITAITVVVAVLAVLAAVGGYLAYHHAVVAQNGCQATGRHAVALDTEQAAIAATIAGVAHARRLPPAAVTIAYATALQESKMHNLPGGDLDYVGVFQQRPSQGWGRPRQLHDPVYATGRFFAALVQVPHYLRLPLYQAAQAVQHSADGFAYTNYQVQAASMSRAFTGGRAHAVWCWFPGSNSRPPDVGPMRRQLLRTFGRLDVRLGAQVSARRAGGGTAAVSSSPASSSPAAVVRVSHPAAGWAVASWLVTHATAYGLTSVRYAGYQWNLTAGSHGWTRDPTAPRGRVELR